MSGYLHAVLVGRTEALVDEYRREVEEHRGQYERWKANQSEVKALRDAEPIVKCVNPFGDWPCGAEMRRGDYRCHLCGSPNPEYVHRGVDPILWGDA